MSLKDLSYRFMRGTRVFTPMWISAIVLAGCSPTLFFSKQKASSVSNTTQYRKLNLACGGMDLSTSSLDQATFRSVLKCFNANHALEPVSKLMDQLNDEQLSPFVEFLNKYILNDKKRLYEIEQTFQALSSEGIVDDSFQQFGKLLKNRQLISSSIALLREGFFVSRVPAQVDPDFLKLIEWISSRFDYQQLLEGIEFGMNLTSSPSFLDLQKDLRSSPSETFSNNTFENTMSDLFSYMQSEHVYMDHGTKKRIAAPVFFAIHNGYGFSVGRKLLGTSTTTSQSFESANLKIRLAKLSLLLNQLTQRPSESEPSQLLGLVTALRELREQPIQCLKAAKEIPDLGMYLIGELAHHASQATQFVLKDAPLALASFKSVCSYPPSLQKHFSLLRKIAEAGQIATLAELTHELYEAAPDGREIHEFQKSDLSLARGLINTLGEKSISRARCNGFECLLPLFEEITARDAWKNILLLVSSPTAQGERWLDEILQLLVDPTFLPDRKITPFDLLMRAVSRQDAINFLSFSMSLRDLVLNGTDYPEGFLLHSLNSLRRAYLINQVHPFLDLFREAMRDAKSHEKIYQTFFEISSKPEFLDTIDLFARMAEDGRLKQLLESSIQLFHKFAITGRSLADEKKLQVQKVDSFTPSYFHHLKKEDLIVPPKEKISAEHYAACEKLSFDLSLSETTHPRFNDQLEAYLGCINSEGDQNAAVDAIRFLNEYHPGPGSDSLFEVHLNWLKGLAEGPYALSKIQLRYLTDLWSSSLKTGKFQAASNAFHLFVKGPNQEDQSEGGVAIHLARTLGFVFQKYRDSFVALDQSFAQVLKDRKIPELFGDLTNLFHSQHSSPSQSQSLREEAPWPDSFEDRLAKIEKWTQKTSEDTSVFERIKKWVRAKECATINVYSEEEVELRAREIVNEAFDGITNWDLVDAGNDAPFKRETRRSWKLTEVQKYIQPVLNKMSQSNGSVVQANLNFTQYFSLAEGQPVETFKHYRPDYLLKWFRDGMTDYKLITYYYPGAAYPRVRLVNSLDRFELVMMNVDFSMPIYPNKNMALQFFQEISEGWGDFPDRKLWPEEIQAKYPVGGPRPYNMKEVVDRIIHRVNPTEDLDFLIGSLGLPALPSCYKDPRGEIPDPRAYGAAGWMSTELAADYRIRLYNIKQVHSVLWENSSRGADGQPARMEIFRDLFFELFKSNRPSIRNSWFPSAYGEKSHLYIMLYLSRLGLLRQIGRILQQIPEDAPEWKVIQDLITSVIHLGKFPEAKTLLQSFVAGEKSQYSNHNRIDSMLLWKLIDQIFNFLDEQPKTHAIKNLRETGIYLLAGMQSLENWAPSMEKSNLDSSDLMRETVSLMSQLLRTHGQLILKHPEVLQALGRLSGPSNALKRLYYDKDLERKARLAKGLKELLIEHSGLFLEGAGLMHLAITDPDLQKDFDGLLNTLSMTLQSQEFQNLDLASVLEPIRLFLTHQSPYDSERERALSNHLRNYFAHLLESGQFHPLLIAAHEKPDNFNQVLQVLADGLGKNGDGDLKNFLEIMSRSLSEWTQ